MHTIKIADKILRAPLKTTHLLRCPQTRNPHVLLCTLRLRVCGRLASGQFLEAPVNSGLLEVPLCVELADTIFSRFRGLSGREDMGGYDGMLFVFPWRAKWRMCMRGMKFPLDFVWIDGDKIVGITPNVQPGSVTVKPSKRVDKILEVPAGSLVSHAKEQLLARVEAQ